MSFPESMRWRQIVVLQANSLHKSYMHAHHKLIVLLHGCLCPVRRRSPVAILPASTGAGHVALLQTCGHLLTDSQCNCSPRRTNSAGCVCTAAPAACGGGARVHGGGALVLAVSTRLLPLGEVEEQVWSAAADATCCSHIGAGDHEHDIVLGKRERGEGEKIKKNKLTCGPPLPHVNHVDDVVKTTIKTT